VDRLLPRDSHAHMHLDSAASRAAVQVCGCRAAVKRHAGGVRPTCTGAAGGPACPLSRSSCPEMKLPVILEEQCHQAAASIASHKRAGEWIILPESAGNKLTTAPNSDSATRIYVLYSTIEFPVN